MKIGRKTLTILLFSTPIIYTDILIAYRRLSICPQDMGFLLGIFITVLATISALIFPIFFTNAREIIYTRRDEHYVATYLCMFILGIFISVFSVVGIFSLGDPVFKISLILFLDCLILLPLYLFVIIKSDALKVIRKTRNSISDELNPIPFVGGEIKEYKIIEKIDALGRFTLQALSNHNYIALETGINYFMDVHWEIMQKPKISMGTENLFIKEIMRIFRDLGIACVENKYDEYSRQIGKHMSKIMMYGVKDQKNFEYPNLVLCLEKLGIAATKRHLKETTDEILNSLGQIGDLSVRKDLQRPPSLAVLKSLQNIGIVCAKKKMVHQCATARTRMFEIAKRGDETIRDEALKRFWVVTSYMYTNTPEIEEANYGLETKLREEFGSTFFQMIDNTIEMLHNEGEWIQKRTVKEFKNTFKFLKE